VIEKTVPDFHARTRIGGQSRRSANFDFFWLGRNYCFSERKHEKKKNASIKEKIEKNGRKNGKKYGNLMQKNF
jgi:hypothetical protein